MLEWAQHVGWLYAPRCYRRQRCSPEQQDSRQVVHGVAEHEQALS